MEQPPPPRNNNPLTLFQTRSVTALTFVLFVFFLLDHLDATWPRFPEY